MTKTVFICHDTVQDNMFADAARLLQEHGVRVVRGPRNEVGKRYHYSAEERAQLFSGIDVGVFSIRHAVTRELLQSAPRMRALCFPTIGVESLDLSAANDLGVLVAHGATQGNIIGMAEATIMLALNLLYKLADSEHRMKANIGKPDYPLAQCLMGKTMGFLGFGRISKAMALRLQPFDVRMITSSPRTPPESLPAGVRKVDLDTLMRESDVLCTLVSITPETRGIIGERELSLLKPSAYLINTGRGEAIDEAALYRALAAKQFAGAALDTFVVEPLPEDSPLRTLDNVILTPHMVGQTQESRDEFAPVIAENVLRMLRGELPVHCKNPEAAARWLSGFGKTEAASA